MRRGVHGEPTTEPDPMSMTQVPPSRRVAFTWAILESDRAPATSKELNKSDRQEFSLLNWLEWIVLAVAVLGVFIVGDLVLCGGQACKHLIGRD